MVLHFGDPNILLLSAIRSSLSFHFTFPLLFATSWVSCARSCSRAELYCALGRTVTAKLWINSEFRSRFVFTFTRFYSLQLQLQPQLQLGLRLLSLALVAASQLDSFPRTSASCASWSVSYYLLLVLVLVLVLVSGTGGRSSSKDLVGGPIITVICIIIALLARCCFVSYLLLDNCLDVGLKLLFHVNPFATLQNRVIKNSTMSFTNFSLFEMVDTFS